MMNLQNKPSNNNNWLVTYSDLMMILLVLFILMFTYSSPSDDRFSSAIDSFKNTGILDFHQSIIPPVIIDEQPEQIEDEEQNDSVSGDVEISGPDPEDFQDFEVPDELQDQVTQMIDREVEILELLQFVHSYALENELENELQIDYTERGIEFTLPEIMLFPSGEADLVDNAISFLRNISPMLEEIEYTIEVEGHTDNIPIETNRFPSNWDLSTGRANEVIRFFVEEEGLEAQRFKSVGYGEYHPIDTNETVEGRSKNRRVVMVIVNE